jgi:hypothetical protein
MSSSGSGTVINYGSGSDFLTCYGSGSTSQKVTVPTVPVPVPQHCCCQYMQAWSRLQGLLSRLQYRSTGIQKEVHAPPTSTSCLNLHER